MHLLLILMDLDFIFPDFYTLFRLKIMLKVIKCFFDHIISDFFL